MATGTGNLPYPGKVYNPFDILTAEELNEDVANIESLADGTGIGDGAVTPAKRSGGFYANTFTFSAGTGIKTLTGFGFKPKEVQFVSQRSAGTTALTSTGGAVDVGGTVVQYVSSTGSAGSNGATNAGITSSMIISSGLGTILFRANMVSFDADGVTIDVITDEAASRSWTVIARA